jgi:glutamate dehydrogenase/leucine dehydrogenase
MEHAMLTELHEFEQKKPELVVEWNDRETEARGWLVINSLRGGAAGGGTRMRAGLDPQEVLFLAKTMEIKFTVSGPAIGGAKSGIDFDPQDPRKAGVLRRWYRAITPLLKSCYGTGGDLNVDFINEVVPFTRELGILHPQEGILAGHLGGNHKEQKAQKLLTGTSRVVRDENYTPDAADGFTVADLVSGYSLAESVLHYYQLYRDGHAGKKAIIQGWGNVGSAAGYYLAQAGVKVIAILDKYGGVINLQGFSSQEIRSFMLARRAYKFPGYEQIPYEVMMAQFWNLPADIFIPAAASKLVTRDQVGAMIEAGVELIACGANVPFADQEDFFGPIAEYTDNQISVIPDFIANCGMARVFAYLMGENPVINDGAIFKDISDTVKIALESACKNGGKPTGITQVVYQDALKQLV